MLIFSSFFFLSLTKRLCVFFLLGPTKLCLESLYWCFVDNIQCVVIMYIKRQVCWILTFCLMYDGVERDRERDTWRASEGDNNECQWWIVCIRVLSSVYSLVSYVRVCVCIVKLNVSYKRKSVHLAIKGERLESVRIDTAIDWIRVWIGTKLICAQMLIAVHMI